MEYVITTLTDEISVRQLITIYYFEFETRYRFDGESHDFWEMVFVDGGEMIINAETGDKTLSKGDIVFYPPNWFHSHRGTASEPLSIMVLSFICHSPSMNKLANKVLNLNDQQAGWLTKIIEEARKAFASPLDLFLSCELIRRSEPNPASEQLVRIYLELLLIDLLRSSDITAQSTIQTTIKKMADNEKADKIIFFLRDNIYRRIYLRDICDYTTLSATNVKSIFKKKTGQPVMEYYMSLKITEAKRLIRKGNLRINEISDMLAYTSVQYFTKHFKKSTGFTPTQYAATIKARQGYNYL